MLYPYSQLKLKHFLLFIFLFSAITSCKKENQISPDITQNIFKVNYSWGELAINKRIESDVIFYNTNSSIDSVNTFDADKLKIRSIAFSYTADTIKLNTSYNDKYNLDATGRVIYHSTEEVQNGYNIVSIERFTYDAAGYLNKVTMSSIFDHGAETVFSVINYEVNNGNYVKFALSNINDGTITRAYNFTYNTAKKVKSPVSFFSPIFANNTASNIDKYLNYGKPSANLPTGLSYYLTNLDGTISTGTFNIVATVNNNNYISSLQLVGNNIAKFPSDNVSPLPRSMSFEFAP